MPFWVNRWRISDRATIEKLTELSNNLTQIDLKIDMAPFTITISHNLQLENVPSEIMEILTERLEILNPKWLENERMKRWNRGTPKSLRFFDRVGSSGLWIPRGYMRQLVFAVPTA